MFEEYCSRCGECCRHYAGIPVTKKDVKRWKKNGRKDILEKLVVLEEDFVMEGGIRLFDKGDRLIETGEDKYCTFLNREERVCSIYEERPEVCRKFPLTPSGTLWIYPESCTVGKRIKGLYD